MVRIWLCFGLILMLTGALWGKGYAGQLNAMRAPAAATSEQSPVRANPGTAFPSLVFDLYLRFFQGVISPVDGARSNMYPTGSAYARQAFAKHGVLMGLVLTTERLMHEGNEGQVAPRIQKYGLWRIYDPVEANDWWWQEPVWVYRAQPDALRR
jgi:hypothetical protein